ncbi:VPLPA-CTERM sorting domain-containing protein [Jannaschia seohaensis]|uniref:Putative secreted protein n=1 Tax=Jannaschia seohaensis TaxID=475081 RepID=A0A2Y9C2Q0_9RHOB|nr:VPLPA-CTERM sorting domain-containing protein [Jannaschia seohaensis]PWJ14390.1 putative secreted protein [Jannaschia seohaensis]SSA50102.1 VPLPA-CTERM protein sorting domain-containing protein [Jannaschia seohaensis]
MPMPAHLGSFLFVATVLCAAVAQAATVTYSDRTTFLAQLSASDTDTFDRAVYASGDVGSLVDFERYSDAGMSAVRGETDFASTGFSDLHYVGQVVAGLDSAYCAGCNGSFRLGFTTTSLGTTQGVGGVGVTIDRNSSILSYDAFVTFGDNSTATYDLGTGGRFFGIASDSLVQSIHVTQASGQPTTDASSGFVIDDLTIGTLAPVPLGPALPLMLSGIGALALMRRRRAA